MKLKYENTFEDIIEFNKHHYSNSPTFRKQKRQVLIIMPIIIFILMLLLFILENKIEIIIFGSIFIAFLIFFSHREFTSGLSKKIRKIYEEQDTSGIVCEHTLEIDNKRIVEKTELNERSDSWRGVQKIAVEDNFTLIYIGANQAHIIPKDRILNGDYNEFIEKTKHYWEQTKSGPGTP